MKLTYTARRMGNHPDPGDRVTIDSRAVKLSEVLTWRDMVRIMFPLVSTKQVVADCMDSTPNQWAFAGSSMM